MYTAATSEHRAEIGEICERKGIAAKIFVEKAPPDEFIEFEKMAADPKLQDLPPVSNGNAK